MHFKASTEARDPFKLCTLLEAYTNELWVPAHCTPEQAAAFALDQFRRTVNATLEQIELTCDQAGASEPC